MLDKVERIIFTNLEEQSKIINKCFKEMGVAIDAYIRGSEDITKSISKIKKMERESIKIRQKNLEIVAQTVTIYRSDFFRLVMKMQDVMANQAGAIVRLGHIKFIPRNDDPMIPKFDSLTKTFIKMGDILRNLIGKLGENMALARDLCNDLDEVEDQIDQIYRDLHGHLYNRDDIPLRIIMQLLSVAKHIEEACDHVDSVADSVRIILATH